MYGRLVTIANSWNARLGRSWTYPATHREFLAMCASQGQRRSSPILLRYEPGACNALHRDISGRLLFPFQLAVTLGPGCASHGGGGEFLLAESGTRRKSKARAIATEVGDGVVFCAREHIERVADVYGLRPVRHGLAPVGTVERYALGLPFHEYRG